MKRCLVLLAIALLFNSCYTTDSVLVHNYNPTPADLKRANTKLDFSKGEWLLALNVSPEVKEELTEMVVADFQKHLGSRLKNSIGRKLLLAENTPLKPSEKQIKELKIGTGFDYFINIQSSNGKTDLSNFNWTEHSYFKTKETFATLTLEIYDLNLQQIVYSQSAKCNVPQHPISIAGDETEYVVKSCYKKIYQHIKRKLRQE